MTIVTLVVDRQRRGIGVGLRLVEEAEKIAKKLGCSVIDLMSGKHRIKSGTHDFYKKLGYRSDSDTVYFRKKLKS